MPVTDAPGRSGHRRPVRRAQQLLEGLYALDEGPCATGFLVTERATVTRLVPGLRDTDEHVLVREQAGEMELLLYLDRDLLDRIAAAGPLGGTVSLAAAGDLQVLLEGVSHFRYIVDRADEGRSTCLLELELQAEVDKFFALCLLFDPARPQSVTGPLWQLQFERAQFHRALTPPEFRLYHEAHRLAARFCRRLLRRHRGGGMAALLRDLRAFRDLGGHRKFAAAAR